MVEYIPYVQRRKWFAHQCLRCEGTWSSRLRKPLRCGKCKSPYWNVPRKEKP